MIGELFSRRARLVYSRSGSKATFNVNNEKYRTDVRNSVIISYHTICDRGNTLLWLASPPSSRNQGMFQQKPKANLLVCFYVRTRYGNPRFLHACLYLISKFQNDSSPKERLALCDIRRVARITKHRYGAPYTLHSIYIYIQLASYRQTAVHVCTVLFKQPTIQCAGTGCCEAEESTERTHTLLSCLRATLNKPVLRQRQHPMIETPVIWGPMYLMQLPTSTCIAQSKHYN